MLSIYCNVHSSHNIFFSLLVCCSSLPSVSGSWVGLTLAQECLNRAGYMQECVILHLESQPVADLQKVHQHFQCSNKRHRIQNKTGTNKACIISASLSGTLGNPIIIDD